MHVSNFKFNLSIILDERKITPDREIARINESSKFVSHWARMSREFDPRKDSHSTKFKRRSQVLLKLSFREFYDLWKFESCVRVVWELCDYGDIILSMGKKLPLLEPIFFQNTIYKFFNFKFNLPIIYFTRSISDFL